MFSVNYKKTLSEPMQLPKGERATKLKFLFALKFDDNGHVERHKARLVFQHVKRISTVDWDKIFAPVVGDCKDFSVSSSCSRYVTLSNGCYDCIVVW